MPSVGGIEWPRSNVLVTGGASFIGSYLVDQLVERGARVCVVDDLTSGHRENLAAHLSGGRVEFTLADLREPGVTRQAMQGIDVVFHLAADHGGRGYVDLHQAGPASNFFLDGLVFFEAQEFVGVLSRPSGRASISLRTACRPWPSKPLRRAPSGCTVGSEKSGGFPDPPEMTM